MAKRRYLSQLPAIHQTQTLQKFFSATVDQVFQPGVTQSINAFIGRKPSYFDAARDFYKSEYNAERSFYQLEPAMTATAESSSEFSDLLFYQDLVNNLRFQGANTTNHSRLFETDMYSWCPPINVHKLTNYREYYWLPDGPPVMVLDIPVAGDNKTYVGDGVKSRFAIPQGVVEMTENVAVKVDGVLLTSNEFNKVGSDVFLVTYDVDTATETEVPLAAGSVLQVWLNGSYIGNGFNKAFELPVDVQTTVYSVVAHVAGVPQSQAAFTVSGTTLTFTTAPADGASVKIWVNPNFAQNINGKDTYTHALPIKAYAAQTQKNELTGVYQTISFPEIIVDTPPAIERGFRVEIRDNNGTNLYAVERDPEGKLVLETIRTQVFRQEPLHTCIERSAPMRSLWSRTNHWFHKDVMFYFADNYTPARAQRPIIEFQGDLKLFNYGLRRIPDVNSIVDTIVENPWQFQGWDSAAVSSVNNVPQVSINGAIKDLPTGRVLFRKVLDTTGGYPVVDNQILEIRLQGSSNGLPQEVLAYDSEILAFAPVDSNNPGQYVGAGNDLAVWSNYDNDGWDTDYTVEITQRSPTAQNDIFKLSDELKEYWFDGTAWLQTQEFGGTYEPLFDLFDGNSLKRTGIATTRLGDATLYPESTFAGNKIFAYNRGTGTNDSVLGFPLKRNKFGNLEFRDHLDDEVTYKGGVVKGFKYFAHTSVQRLNADYDVYQATYDPLQALIDPTDEIVNRYDHNWKPAGASSQTQNADSFYEIPSNLQGNPLNENLEVISINDWNEHLKPVLSGNNWDLASANFDLSLGRKILQHRSPLLRTMFMNSNTSVDFMKAVIYNEREYLRYRNKFAQSLKTIAQSTGISDIDDTLTAILTQLRLAKTNEFPFANSGMAGGDWFIPATAASLGISPVWKPEFIVETSRTKDSQVLMIRGHDGSLTPGFTRGTAADPITQPTYDVRDLVMMAFEQAIYDNINSAFKTMHRPLFDLTEFKPGKYRTSDYTRDEMLTVARPMFERWASQSQFNYRENTTYDSNNAWTFNYRCVTDIDGDALPGNWRGVYTWYFDTDRPHTHPWEMLGFTSKPADWDAHYSWTDSTKRVALINAVTLGIVDATTGEVNDTFARPGFTGVNPVSTTGALLDPIQAGVIIDSGYNKFNQPWDFGDMSPVEYTWWTSHLTSFSQAQLSYLLKPARFVESNWATLDEVLVHDQQWVSPATGWREYDATATVHNELVDGVAVRKFGIQTWISDYVRSQGRNVTTVLGNHVRTLGVNLAHKLGGFIDGASLKTFTENSGLIPQEDVLTALYRSPSVREEFYGGVITEWMGSGWRIIGYDMVDPVFKTFEVKPSGRRAQIALSDVVDTAVDWKPDTYFSVGLLAFHEGTNYRCVKTHTSGTKFEAGYWNAESVGRLEMSAKVTWYFDHESDVVRIPYGTILRTRQDVADFLSGYQAYLESRGWDFDNYDADLNETKDFRYAIREFLYWTQTRWTEGSFIALSPSAQGVKFKTDHGTIQNVEQLVNGAYSIVDRGGLAITPKFVTTNRMDDEITVGVTEGGIYGLRIYVSEIEQAIVFKNTTIFGDVIYDPQFDLRQARIRILANISQDWVGRLDAPGFVITDNKLVPSFEQQVEDLRYMYDIEKAVNLPLRDNARHQVGYQSRSYLENLMYNEVNQFEFYQGAIQQKGAPGVFSKLLRNDELTATRSLSFLEEWAFRQGEYGAVEKDSIFEFILDKYQVKAEPQQIEFVKGGDWDIAEYENVGDPLELTYDIASAEKLYALDRDDDTVIRYYESDGNYDSRWIVPKNGNAFPTTVDFTRNKSALPTAGYARTTDTKFQAFTFADFNTMISANPDEVQLADRVWIYKNALANWSIYRASTPHKTVDFTLDGSEFISRLQLNAAGQDVSLGATEDKHAVSYRLTMTNVGSLVIGNLIEILNNKVPALGISGIFEITDYDLTANWIEVRHGASEVGAYEQGVDSTRIVLGSKHNLQVGDSVYITKEINENQTGFGGIHTVLELDVLDEHAFYVDGEVTEDYEYWANETKPSVFRMVDMRFTSNSATDHNRVNTLTSGDLAAFAEQIDPAQLSVGELIYVDVCYDVGYQAYLAADKRRWAVYEKTSTGFAIARKQPIKVRRDLVRDVKLFETLGIRTSRTLNAKPLINSEILILDPSQGLVPGVAQKEVWYKLDFDPAAYNQGPEGDLGVEWGEAEVGRLWWDLSTTRYLISETDEVGDYVDDSQVEKDYRATSWGKIAPGTSIDIYEWTKSSIAPLEWQTAYEANTATQVYDGAVYGGSYGNYVETTEWDEGLAKFVPVYFFWVKNRIYAPGHVDFRSVSAKVVSEILSNPVSQGLSWVAPIAKNNLIVSGLTQFLTATSSMQFTVAKTEGDTKRHVEWDIMRKGDERSLPGGVLWSKMMTSLAGRDVWGNVVPSTDRYYTDRLGFDVEHGQNLFKDVKAARKHLVRYLNSVFAKSMFVDERRDPIILNNAEGSNASLNWTQSIDSYYIKPVPHKKLWFSLVDRLDAVAEPTQLMGESLVDYAVRLASWKFENNAALNAGIAYSYDTDKSYLIRNLRLGEAYWSVLKQDLWDAPDVFTPWDMFEWNPEAADATPPTIYDASHDTEGWETFEYDALGIDQMWQYEIANVEDLETLWGTIGIGDRVKVAGNDSTGGFWTLWEFNGGGFDFVQTQRYDTADAWSYADWFADGYTLADTPQDVYATVTARDIALGPNPTKLLVKVLSDGKGRWMWTEYVDGLWTVVAKQNGTIKLNDSVWSNYGNYFDEGVYSPTTLATDVANRDLGWELNSIVNTLREEILTDAEINELFFSMVEYAHTEQDYIDWAFKTSFMCVTGYGDRLRQDPVAYADLTGNLLDYINEVKPYHVKVRDFISKYSIDNEIAHVYASDYDKPVYVDSNGVSRVLRPEIAADLKILSAGKWVGWFDQWNLYQQGVNDYMPLVRKLKVSSKYQDNVIAKVAGSIRIRVFRQGDAGAPTIQGAVVPGYVGSGVTVQLEAPAQHRTSTAVFEYGLRVDPDAITYDAASATFGIDVAEVESTNYEYQSFGYGATGAFKDIKYFTKTQAVETFNLGSNVIASQVMVMLEGNYVSINGGYTVDSNGFITINDPTLGMLTVLILVDATKTFNTVQAFSYKGAQLTGKTFATLHPALADSANWPINEHFIVEVDGKRVNPEWNHNVNVSSMNKNVLLDRDGPVADLRAAFNHVDEPIADGIWKIYTLPGATRSVLLEGYATVDRLTVLDYVTNTELIIGEIIADLTPETPFDPDHPDINSSLPWQNIDQVTWNTWFDAWQIDGQFEYLIAPANADLVLVNNRLISLNAMNGNRFLDVRIDDHLPASFDGYHWSPQNARLFKFTDKLFWKSDESGLLTVTDANGDFKVTNNVLSKFPNTQRVSITEFNNPQAMDIRAHAWRATGEYDEFPISALGPNKDSYWVTVNGVRLVNGVDYTTPEAPRFYDEFIWDVDGWGEDDYFFQGIVAGQNLGGYDGLREHGLTGEDSALWDAYPGDFRPKAYDTFEWDRHSAVIKFTNYAVQEGDIIIITVFAAEQSTSATEYEVFVRNSESTDTTANDILDDTLGQVLEKDVFVLVQAIDQDDTTIKIKPPVRPNTAGLTVEPTGRIWVGAELITYTTATYDAVTNVTTLTGVERGVDITSAQNKDVGTRVTAVTPFDAEKTPL